MVESVEKKEALAKAKADWIEKGLSAKVPEVKIANCVNETREVLASELTTPPGVILFQNNMGCHFTLKSGTAARLLIANCKNCTVTIQQGMSLLTRTVEIWNSDAVVFNTEIMVGTVQIDLCKEISIHYARNDLFDQIVQAAVEYLKVSFGNTPDQNFISGTHAILEELKQSLLTSTQKDKKLALTNEIKDLADPTTQYITRMIGFKIITEHLVRLQNDFPTTMRENKDFHLKSQSDLSFLEQKASDLELKLTEEERKEITRKAKEAAENAPVIESEQELKAARAELKRVKGNDEFKNGSVNQAVLLYTESLMLIPAAAVYANRSACFLKLGEVQKALDDANSCIQLDSKYVKAYFRKGVCLMQLDKHLEACVAFKQCLDLDPTNKDARSSLATADMKYKRSLDPKKK